MPYDAGVLTNVSGTIMYVVFPDGDYSVGQTCNIRRNVLIISPNGNVFITSVLFIQGIWYRMTRAYRHGIVFVHHSK